MRKTTTCSNGLKSSSLTFSTAFARRFALALRRVPEAAGEALDRIKKYGDEGCTLSILFEGLSEFCASAPKPVVLLIDEVDSASNNPAGTALFHAVFGGKGRV